GTRRGGFQGVAEGELVVFRGVPFARARRFMPPERPPAWNDVRDATRFAPAAPQNATMLGPLLRLGIDRPSEACLFLNVWTPGLADGRRPVLVWIHGGAFVIGAGSQTIYDGAVLARRGDVVVVTVNYRLGTLGFLRLSDVAPGAPPATGNEGLLDQVAALEWV